MRYLICGSRTFLDKERMRAVLVSRGFGPSDVVITGGAKGADSLGHELAVELGCETEVYPADWNKYGKGAGPVRNQQMLDEGKPEFILAFVDRPLTESRGTADMVRRAKAARLTGCTYTKASAC